MRAHIMLAMAGLTALLLPQGTLAQNLMTDLSTHTVQITSSFSGTSLLLFGAVQERLIGESGVDVIVVVRGPRTPATVYRKARIGGVWINEEAGVFDNVPGYYAVSANRNVTEIASDTYLKRYQIGSSQLDFRARGDLPAEERHQLEDAIAAERMRQGLYIEEEDGVTFTGRTLFRTDIPIPSQVPTGDYVAEVYLLRDGREVERHATTLTIEKSGLDAFIYRAAHGNSLLYGLVAILIASLAGWLAALIFRRTDH